MGGIEAHRRIPLSLTFDHRCCTGGEACRFLGGVIEDPAEAPVNAATRDAGGGVES